MDEFSIPFDGTVTTFKQTIMVAPKSLKAKRQNKGSQFSISEKAVVCKIVEALINKARYYISSLIHCKHLMRG